MSGSGGSLEDPACPIHLPFASPPLPLSLSPQRRRCLPAASWRWGAWTWPSSSRPRWPPRPPAAPWPPCSSRRAACLRQRARQPAAWLLARGSHQAMHAWRQLPILGHHLRPFSHAPHLAVPSRPPPPPPHPACRAPPSCGWLWNRPAPATCQPWWRGCACCTAPTPWCRWRCRRAGSMCCAPLVGGWRSRGTVGRWGPCSSKQTQLLPTPNLINQHVLCCGGSGWPFATPPAFVPAVPRLHCCPAAPCCLPSPPPSPPGEVHLETCVKDLRERFARVDLVVSPPLVAFRRGAG